MNLIKTLLYVGILLNACIVIPNALGNQSIPTNKNDLPNQINSDSRNLPYLHKEVTSEVDKCIFATVDLSLTLSASVQFYEDDKCNVDEFRSIPISSIYAQIKTITKPLNIFKLPTLRKTGEIANLNNVRKSMPVGLMNFTPSTKIGIPILSALTLTPQLFQYTPMDAYEAFSLRWLAQTKHVYLTTPDNEKFILAYYSSYNTIQLNKNNLGPLLSYLNLPKGWKAEYLESNDQILLRTNLPKFRYRIIFDEFANIYIGL
jgi:hypothetical protein